MWHYFLQSAEGEALIRLADSDFSVDDEVAKMRKKSVGGIVTFIGTVRGESEEGEVNLMEIEIYPEMAEKQLHAISEEAIEKFNVDDVRIVHRHGRLRVGDNIVLIAVSAGHRDEAFSACRYVIDELKKRVPIWKREQTASGARWVEEGIAE
jgi:molybdopterin synthase catalytic subunit